jgi:periplasmic protein TonB
VRRSFTLLSVIAHATAMSAALIAQVLAVGPLPVPHAPITFVGAMPIAIVEPPPPPRRPDASAAPEPATSDNAAPIAAPTGVAPEPAFTPPVAPGSVVDGVDGGLPGFGTPVARVLPAPPPPPPPPPAPIRLHSGMQAPRKIVNVDPVYPRAAQMAHIGGVVILEAVIDARGRVETVRVLRSLALLDQAAADAVRQWVFTPALLNGVAVPVVMTVTVNFELTNR